MNKRFLFGLGSAILLGASTTVFAATDTVPIENLRPATHLDKPQLMDTGGKLILSDSPETLYAADGAFYRDSANGEFRVFWHHQNELQSGQSTNVAVAITNTSDETIQLFTDGVGISTNYYPDVAGQSALAAFMQTHIAKQFVTSLAPGNSYFLAANTPYNDTTSGIAQFVATTQHTHQPATVTVTTLSYQSQPSDPTSVPILPGDTDHVRGSFPHFDRTGTIEYNTQLGNAFIELSSSPPGYQWTDSLPNEYEAGIDAVDGNSSVLNDGNYGVLYNLTVQIDNGFHQPRQIQVYDNPAGGYGHYVMVWNHQMSESDWLPYWSAWQFAQLVTGASGNQYSFQTSLPGGAAGPSVIYFTNSDVK